MTPTQAQNRQTAFAILTKHPNCLRDDVPLDDLIEDIAAALTAAAEVDETGFPPKFVLAIQRATIERCAQVADSFKGDMAMMPVADASKHIAAAIRALATEGK